MGVFCPACGGPGRPDGHGHEGCAQRLVLDPPRWCGRCGHRLDVQVLPTSVRSGCRRCDGGHPARRSADDEQGGRRPIDAERRTGADRVAGPDHAAGGGPSRSG